MKLILNRGYSLVLRLFLAMIVAIILIIVDSRLDTFVKVRSYIDTVVSQFYFIAHHPRQILHNLSQMLTTNAQLKLENSALRQKLRLNKSEQLLLGEYQKENIRLRKLLRSPLRADEQKMVTKVISLRTDPYRHQVVIDKGWQHGVYIGQPVISDQGVVGQIIATSKFTSRILLICDSSHALPIQVLRNDVRVIIVGNGCNTDLLITHLPYNADIRVGDVLVTSSLGGRFPEGYPVAVVSSVKLDTQHTHTIIKARPTAMLQRLRYLLLLWSTLHIEVPLPPDEISRVAKVRLIQIMQQDQQLKTTN